MEYILVYIMRVVDTDPVKQVGQHLKKISVLIADDHELIRRSLRNLLHNEPDMMVIGESVDGMETIALASKLKPDVVIMDIQMPKFSGIEATKQIKEISPDTIILVLTIYDDNEHVLRILEAGASGYLTKSVIGREIPNAIRAVMNGDSILSEEIMKKLLNYALRYPTKAVALNFGDKLSEREMEILNLAAKGASNKTIAAELDLSLNTVKKYMMSIFDKLQARSRTEAVINAQQAGLLSIENLS